MTTANLDHVGPKARHIIKRDTKFLATSYAREYPLVIDTAEGAQVWDVDGRRYIDFMAGISVLNVGHRHPRVVEAVRSQVDRFWHICLSDFYYSEAVDLAEELDKIAPMGQPTRTYFGNSGTEAVEAAAKLAMVHTGRSKFIGFLGAFHGRTLGALSFTASKTIQSAQYPHSLEVFDVPYPDPYRPLLVNSNGGDYGSAVISYIEEQLFRVKLSPYDVAAVLVEPIQGEGGYIVPSADFLPQLRRLCDRYDMLLIVDEVQSGVGRTGRWWAIEHEQVEPDIVCFAKGIASGLPLGGILVKDEVMSWQPGAHGSTFGGNPVAIAAANATLEVIREEDLLAKAAETGQTIMDALSELQSRYASIGQIRGRGLMIGLEFVLDRQTKRRASALRDSVVTHAFELGLLTLPAGENSLRLTPPLNIDHSLVAEGLEKLEAAIATAEATSRTP